jgi:hypothetical protein
MIDVAYVTLVYHSFSSRDRLGIGCPNTEMGVVMARPGPKPESPGFQCLRDMEVYHQTNAFGRSRESAATIT